MLSTSMQYDVWWLGLSKSGSWYSNPSTQLHVQCLMVHLYGKVEGKSDYACYFLASTIFPE